MTQEEKRWLDLALADQQRRLAELEADLPEGEKVTANGGSLYAITCVETWLRAMRDASAPVRWDPEKLELLFY